ncbi:MAG: VWA domain-containing protein [Burkholderiaceae bacterium]|nr:VWA domain-containing protein [Burkholderiaceae bacterium]
MVAHLSLSTAVVLAPRRAGLRAGQDNVVEILVRIQAPDAPVGHTAVRPPQAIALVIDRSGSMEGRPLAEARRCAEYVVGKLRPTDTVSLVQFDNRVQRLWPAVPLGDGAPLRAAIAGIHSGGNTHLHGGWCEGAETLSDVAGTGLKRVILLSDGQANEGLTDATAIAAQCAEWAARGVTTSTYGLGNSFNEELMVAMARAGGGNHYYGDTAEDLMDPFQQELELLGNLCLRDLRLSAAVPDGVEVQMVNDLPAVDGGWRLPDLAWGAEAWAVLRLKVPAGALPPLGQLLSVLRVSVEGRSLEGEAVTLERAGLALPVMSASAFDKLTDDELVSRRLVELAAADALSRMRGAAAHRDWAAVDRLLEEASRQFAGNEWVAAVLAAMKELAQSRSRERMMKESMYSASKLRSRLSAKDEGVSFSVASESIERPAYLRRKPSQGKGDV